MKEMEKIEKLFEGKQSTSMLIFGLLKMVESSMAHVVHSYIYTYRARMGIVYKNLIRENFQKNKRNLRNIMTECIET